MKADKLTISLSICSLLFAGLLYYFSLCEVTLTIDERPWPFKYESMSDIYLDFCKKRATIGGYVFVFILLFHFGSFISLEKDKKKWLRAFLKHIIQKDLGGNQFETRITIFKVQRGIWFIPKYLLRCAYSLNSLKAFSKKIANIPNPFKLYLVPYIRYSYPNSSPSTTYFDAEDNEDSRPQSVVERCYKEGTTAFATLPYIKDIELPKEFERIDGEVNKDLVKQYMDGTSMSYKKLRNLGRKANDIYAVIIGNNEDADDPRWGIMIFDRISHETNLQEQLSPVIAGYIKIVEFSVRIIN